MTWPLTPLASLLQRPQSSIHLIIYHYIFVSWSWVSFCPECFVTVVPLVFVVRGSSVTVCCEMSTTICALLPRRKYCFPSRWLLSTKRKLSLKNTSKNSERFFLIRSTVNLCRQTLFSHFGLKSPPVLLFLVTFWPPLSAGGEMQIATCFLLHHPPLFTRRSRA